MLVLSRKSREAVVIGGSDGFHRLLKVTVLDIQGTKVKLGFEADADVPVHRAEVWERIKAEGQAGGLTDGPAAAFTSCFEPGPQ
jgi:carbon storage regulator